MALNARNTQEGAKKPKGFLALTLKRFHKANGKVINPNEEGYFVPEDQEELDILLAHAAHERVEFVEGEVPAVAE